MVYYTVSNSEPSDTHKIKSYVLLQYKLATVLIKQNNLTDDETVHRLVTFCGLYSEHDGLSTINVKQNEMMFT